MLLKEYTSNGTTNTYDGNLVSATCFTNQNVNVKIDIVGDFSVKLAYRWCGFGADLGYNLFGQSHEKISPRCDENCNQATTFHYAPKGTEGVCCFEYPILYTGVDNTVAEIFPNGSTLAPAGTIPAGTKTCTLTNGVGTPSTTNFAGTYTVNVIPNNASQPNATAFNGAPTTANTTTPTGCVVDLAYNSISTVPVAAGTTVSSLVGTTGVVLCNSTNQVNFLDSRIDLNLHSGESVSLLTHKFFGFINYTWYDDCGMNPNFGVGGSVEFNGRRNHQTCQKTDVNQWGIILKGGISF
jgi:hypothetical protein